MEPSRIAALLAPFVTNLDGAQLSQIAAYLELMQRWNARMNLTAVRDPEQMITRHFGESLFAARWLYPQLGTRNSDLVDIGSGAGFPGLPIKIYAPELRVTLLESNQRKATFLREVARALELPDVNVVTERAEKFAAPAVQSLTVTLRAVEEFAKVLPAAVRLLAKAGEGRLALLIGAGQVGTARDVVSVKWNEPVPVPRSEQRVLLVGRTG